MEVLVYNLSYFSIGSIGAESVLVAAATFKRVHNSEDSLRRDKERIIQLALLAVRKRFRKLGVGRQLLNVSSKITPCSASV